MNQQKVFFHTNLKWLRERKKISQEQLGNVLRITRVKLSALEGGYTKAPQPEDLINISDYFKVSVDTLLKVDLTKISELSFRELEAGSDIYMQGGKMRILAITVDKSNKENVEYVPVKAKAGYRAGYSDPEYISALPRFTYPNLPSGGTYRMFPTVGDSMLPIPEGSDILCRYLQDWSAIKPGTLCIAILKGEQDFLFKRVSLKEEGLLMESLNPIYRPYIVSISDVLELWEYHSFQSKNVPEIPDIQHISGTVNEILAEIKDLRNNGR